MMVVAVRTMDGAKPSFELGVPRLLFEAQSLGSAHCRPHSGLRAQASPARLANSKGCWSSDTAVNVLCSERSVQCWPMLPSEPAALPT
jgi:hypothetical protein